MNIFELTQQFIKYAQSATDWEKIDKAIQIIPKLQVGPQEIVKIIPEIKSEISDLLMIFKNVEKIALNIYNNVEDDSLFNDAKKYINELINNFGELKGQSKLLFKNIQHNIYFNIGDDLNVYFKYLSDFIEIMNVQYFYSNRIEMNMVFNKSKFEDLLLNILQIQNGRKKDASNFEDSVTQFSGFIKDYESKIKKLFSFFKKINNINIELQDVPSFDYVEFFKWLDSLLEDSIDILIMFNGNYSSLELVRAQLKEQVRNVNLDE